MYVPGRQVVLEPPRSPRRFNALGEAINDQSEIVMGSDDGWVYGGGYVIETQGNNYLYGEQTVTDSGGVVTVTDSTTNNWMMDTANYAVNESTQTANNIEKVLTTDVAPTFAKSEADAAVKEAFNKNNAVVTAISDVAVAKSLSLLLGHLGLLGVIVKTLADATGVTQSAKLTVSNFINNPSESITTYSTNAQSAAKTLSEAKNNAAAADILAGNNDASNIVNEAIKANLDAANAVKTFSQNTNLVTQSSVQLLNMQNEAMTTVSKINTAIEKTAKSQEKIVQLKKEKAMATTAEIVKGLYSSVVNRTPSQAEVDYWVNAFGPTVEPAEVAAFTNAAAAEIAVKAPAVQQLVNSTGMDKNTLMYIGLGLAALLLLRR